MGTWETLETDARGAARVQGFLHRAGSKDADGLVLTHGAGANCETALLRALGEAFCEAGVTVLRCNLPFRQARPHGPPPRGSADKDQSGLRAAVAALRKEARGRIWMGGHSYGGRQASMLAAIEPGFVERLLLLSYPLHPPQKAEQMRTDHFPSLTTPALFVSGTRDGFGSKEEMETALKMIPARTELLMVESAGHELMTPRNRAELPGQIVRAFREFAG